MGFNFLRDKSSRAAGSWDGFIDVMLKQTEEVGQKQNTDTNEVKLLCQHRVCECILSVCVIKKRLISYNKDIKVTKSEYFIIHETS